MQDTLKSTPRLCVLLEAQHDLRRAVPPRRDVFSHVAIRPAAGQGGLRRAREAKVADLEVAIGIE